jgi:hypothetical protein
VIIGFRSGWVGVSQRSKVTRRVIIIIGRGRCSQQSSEDKELKLPEYLDDVMQSCFFFGGGGGYDCIEINIIKLNFTCILENQNSDLVKIVQDSCWFD